MTFLPHAIPTPPNLILDAQEQHQQRNTSLEDFIQYDKIMNIEDITKMSHKFRLQPNWIIKGCAEDGVTGGDGSNDNVTLVKISSTTAATSDDNNAHEPRVLSSIKIDRNLKVELFVGTHQINQKWAQQIVGYSEKCQRFSKLSQIIKYMDTVRLQKDVSHKILDIKNDITEIIDDNSKNANSNHQLLSDEKIELLKSLNEKIASISQQISPPLEYN